MGIVLATTITLSNGVPIETVSKLLGHTKLVTTQVYARVIERKVSEDMNALKTILYNKSINKVLNIALLIFFQIVNEVN